MTQIPHERESALSGHHSSVVRTAAIITIITDIRQNLDLTARDI